MPAPVGNGGGDRPRKVQFLELQKTRDPDLDLGSGHKAYHRASLIDLYTHTSNFTEIGKTFCGGTDVQTYGRIDGHFRPPIMLLGRLGGVDLKLAATLRGSEPGVQSASFIMTSLMTS